MEHVIGQDSAADLLRLHVSRMTIRHILMGELGLDEDQARAAIASAVAASGTPRPLRGVPADPSI